MTGRARGRARGRGRADQDEVQPPGGAAPIQKDQPPIHPVGRGRSRGPPAPGAGPAPVASGQPPVHAMQKLEISGGPPEQRPAVGEQDQRRRRLGEQAEFLQFKDMGIETTGTHGQPCSIVSNFFKMSQTPSFKGLFQYNVQFDPEMHSQRLKNAMLHQLDDKIGKTRCFDGMTMFMPIKLPEKVNDYAVKTNRGEDYRIKITFTNEIPPNSPSTVQLMNIMFRRQLQHMNMQLIGRNYYNPERKIDIPAHKMQVWPGLSTSILQYEAAVMLCADMSHKVLRMQTVLEVMYEMYQKFGQQRFYEMAVKSLVGEIVLTRYNNKTYRIDDIEWNLHPSDTFERKDGSKISFKEYYETRYNLKVVDDKQPMLISKLKARDMKKGEKGPRMLLPELCSITGLSEEIRQNFTIMKELAIHTRVSPQARMQTLEGFMRELHENPDAKNELTQWNMDFEPRLLRMTGRCYEAERMFQQTADFRYKIQDAEWTKETRGEKLITPVNMTNWVLFHTGRDSGVAQDFHQTIQKVCGPMGISVSNARVVQLQNDDARSFATALKENIEEGRTQIVVCIVPNNRKDRYDAIKKICCVEKPVPSQVIVSRTLSKKQMLMSVCTKVGIQLNCKLGGEIWAVEIPLKNLMVVGIDVYHDSLTKGKSIGGFVASTNKNLTRYFSTITEQQSRMEMFDGLKVCMAAALKNYNTINGALPDRIIIYRDGVGDGQLRDVKEHELPQIQSAISDVAPGYAPKFTFIVVKKRISTRLFLEGPGGQVGNPPPGTVVDTVVTRPEWYDFFLVSQSVRQGTVSPTHYNVVVDTSGMKPDHIQRLSYKLCHLYYNWPGTIRVPAPCQYAHKLAFLVGQSVHKEPDPALRDRLFYL